MASSPTPQILLCADPDTQVGDVGRILREAQFGVEQRVFGGEDSVDFASYQAVILHAAHQPGECLAFCQRLRGRLNDGYLPTLYITSDPAPAARLASLESGADAYLLRPFEPAELLAQVKALLRNKDRHDRLAEKTAEVHRINKRLQQAYQQIDIELELARRIQESFLPHSLPQSPQVRFAVHYQPCGRVGGDFYDVFRLDEKHLGFYVADAMGHGVPASLLTVFVKTGVRVKEINGKQYRLVPPEEVLDRLNRDLIKQQLADTPFITMVYAILNHEDGTLRFSRSGHPHPLVVPRDGEPQFWATEGSLLGVFETHFTVRTEQLQPGDKVLLYTDGMDAASFDGAAPGIANLSAFARKHRDAPIDELVRLSSQELFRTSPQTDDLTVLGFEMLADAQE